MKTINKPVYITEDGLEFTDKGEAERHEKELLDIKYFEFRYAPDLTEGRGCQRIGLIMVHAKKLHYLFAEQKLFDLYGNRIDFVMGVYGSNAITESWRLSPTPISNDSVRDLKEYDCVVRVEEKFITPIWGNLPEHIEK